MDVFKIVAAVVYMLSCIAIIWLVDLQSSVKYSMILVPMALYVAISKIYAHNRNKKSSRTT